MSNSIVLTFALLFSATIALICAVYSYRISRMKLEKKLEEKEINYY